MDTRKIVYRETALIALGVSLGAACTVGVFALLGRFALSVVWGALAGTVITVGNFFLMAAVASLAADRAEKGEVEGAKKLLRSSQLLRLFGVGAALGVCALSGFFNLIALVLPLVFVRPVLLLGEFFRKKGD